MDFKRNLIKINQELASKGIKLRIEQRGARLNLRGPLPCRNSKGLNKVQRISLRLNADPLGLEEAEKMIQLIALQLEHQQFNWNHWLKDDTPPTRTNKDSSIIKAVEEFKLAFFSDPNRRRSLAGARTTWTSAYLPYLRRLIKIGSDMNCNVDKNLLCKTLSSYSENTRSRQQCATSLGFLAKHLNIKLPEDWRAQGNGYGLRQARFRQLPSDDLIKESWAQIPNARWRLVYGLMATYGLRNHEVFFCDLSCLRNGGDQVLRVLPNTKTGEHQVWPFHPDWVDYFSLEKLGGNSDALPLIKTDLGTTTLQQVGKRVAEQFRRYNLPLTPYDLRHAWAIRTIHIGLPDTVAARMMGHSVTIHTQTYHHWITRRDQQQAVDAALGRNNA